MSSSRSGSPFIPASGPGSKWTEWRPPGYEQHRRCTDPCFLLLFLLSWAGLLFVAYIGFVNGNPRQLYRGIDFEGNVCGVESDTRPPDVILNDLDAGTWEERKVIWFPVTPDLFPDSDKMDLSDVIHKVLTMGVCMTECPVANGHVLGGEGKPVLVTSYDKIQQQWPVYYNSSSIFGRCIPQGLDNVNTTLEIVRPYLPELAGRLDTNDIKRMAEELVASWKVLAVCTALSFVLCFIMVTLMRWIAGPLMYIILVLTLLLLVGGGGLLFQHAIALKADAETDYQRNYATGFFIAAVVVWVAALVYFCLLCWMWKQLRIAVEILELASEVIAKVRSLIMIPPCLVIGIVMLTVWALVVWAFLATAGTLTLEKAEVLSHTVDDPRMDKFINVTTAILADDNTADWLSVYTCFEYLWTMAFINALAFQVIAFVVVMWYFSDPWPGDNKEVPMGCVARVTYNVIRYHLGTLALGSLIIAAIQMLRLLFARIHKKMAGGDPEARFCACCTACCLDCCNRMANMVNKNAYIVTCIEGKGFCPSAMLAMRILLENITQVAASNYIAEWVFLFCKICVMVLNGTFAYLFLRHTPLGDDVKVELIPLVLVTFVTWIVASMYMHVFDAAQDTVLMSFCYDKTNNDGSADRPHYFSRDLEKLLRKMNGKSDEEEMPKVAEDRDL